MSKNWFSSSAEDFKGKWVGYLKSKGAVGTFVHALRCCANLIINGKKYLDLMDLWLGHLDHKFDSRFGVDTAGPSISSDEPSNSEYHAYCATSHGHFARMLQFLELDYSEFTFIDIGCGKGKVLLLAAGKPFKRIIGVERSASLVDIAEQNIKNYLGDKSCKVIQLVHSDAADYKFPNDPTICYLYDPFGAETLRTVLRNLQESLSKKPRDIYIFYSVASHRDVLDRSGFLTLVKKTNYYRVYKSFLQPGPHSQVLS